MSADGPSGGRGRVRVGLVVVHGVGETEPGYCVNAVLDTLAATRPGYSVSPANEYNRDARARDRHAGTGISRHSPGRRAHQRYRDRSRGTALGGPGDGSGRPREHVAADSSASSSNPITSSMRCLTGRGMRPRGFSAKILWIAGWLIRGPSARADDRDVGDLRSFSFEPATLTTDVVDVRSQVLIVTGDDVHRLALRLLPDYAGSRITLGTTPCSGSRSRRSRFSC